MYAKTAIFFGVNIREITTLKPETLNLKPDSGVNAFFDNKIRLISLSPITGERALVLSPTIGITGPVRRVRAPYWVPWISLFDPVFVGIGKNGQACADQNRTALRLPLSNPKHVAALNRS